MTDKKITISIPKELADKLEKKIKETGFNSVSDYITYLLKQVVSTKGDTEDKEVYGKEEEEEMKKNLRDLGYL